MLVGIFSIENNSNNQMLNRSNSLSDTGENFVFHQFFPTINWVAFDSINKFVVSAA